MRKPSLLSTSLSGSRQQKRARLHSQSQVTLHVEEVMLDGFARVDGNQIRATLHESLTGAMRLDNSQFDRNVRIEQTADTLNLRPDANASDVGSAVSKTVMQIIQGAAQVGGTATRQDALTEHKGRR